MAEVISKSSNVGGRSATATPGGYNQGAQFGAKTGGSKPGTGKDLRGGNAKSGEYNQGPTVAATSGGTKPGTHKDLRGGSATTGGYNQGAQK